ncbi:3-(3-hydroxyphenyl)propionate 2-hydroxylase [Fusarium phyllophilum]|uniref:3-(3-hydroxyphenyl)propionate 2-hydroxylase n=1 Tax=Fusarium phyllophilum TaxID=47803 RepID=A0A8H5N912_9HYPO|nr:3-(3-hydroxyphenyl)propionate 2-hydroxylase [Fusarium phyllophilum]
MVSGPLPSVNLEFAKAGVVQEVLESGCRSDHGYCWRDGYDTTKVLADLTPPPSENPNLCAAMIGQDVLAQIFLKHLINTGNAEVIFNHAFTRVEDHGDSVTVYARRVLDDQELKFDCRYIVGADGGKSAVRKSIGQSLEGYTWPDIRLIAVNILYDLEKLGWKHGNFIVHPEDWAIVVKRGPKNLWRVATRVAFAQGADGEPITDKAVFPVIKDRLERILPGNTDEIIYLQTAPYTIHQRCLNNPVGGLGLTTGLLDAAHLGKALTQVINDNAPETELDDYATARRDVYKNITDPLSTANLLRVKSTAPEGVAAREGFFKMLNDPNEKGQVFAHMAKEMGLSTTLDMKDLGPRPQL